MKKEEVNKELLQDLYDRAVAGLASQGFQRAVDQGQCMYRAPDGKKCALGHLIPDDKYSPKMEGRLATEALLEEAGLPVKAISFVSRLQHAHDSTYWTDGASDPDKMRRQLREVGEFYGLTIPEVLKQ